MSRRLCSKFKEERQKMPIDLSILIPARNEEFLGRTIQDILENSEADTEIIAILDGYLPNPPLPVSPKVTVIYNPVSVGQRAGTNQAAKIAKGKYVMKADAHLAFDKGFDRKMLEAYKKVGDDVTMIPVMRNLHVFDWICPSGHRRYQSPSGPCEQCGEPTVKDIVWIPKESPQTHSFRFDKTMHFQYHGELSKHPEIQKGALVGYRLSFNTRLISSGIIDLLTGFAGSHQLVCLSNSSWFRQNVSSDTMCFPSIDDSRSIGSSEIDSIRSEAQMERVTASSIVTQMVKNGDMSTPTSGERTNQPSINETMCECFFLEDSASSITTYVSSSSPIPTATNIINSDFAQEFSKILGGNFVYSEKTNTCHNGSVTLTPVYVKDLRESLSIQGSCFMITKEKYFELDICSEVDFHSWGQQGVEVACKTWLSGGRVLVNMNTWYAHMFRTRGGDFGFPYSNPQDKVNENREKSRELFQKDKWPLATRKFQWLLDKFNPPEWGITKGMIYYTTNTLDEKIAKPVRDRLLQISQDKKIDIVSSSLKKMDFGVKNVRFPSLQKGYLTMFKQILGALENSKSDIIFFTEHDVLYHPSHFDFTPSREDTFYYNQNVWYLREDGHALHYDVNQLSGLCVYRDTAITHFRERYKLAEDASKELNEAEFNKWIRHMGFEPMTHNRVKWQNKFPYETWKSEYPNVDIRFGLNTTGMRWKKEQYINQNLLINWQESENWQIPNWNPQDLIVLK